MKSFIKKNIRFIIIVVICITCSVLTTFATTTLFNSSEVYYNNTTSGIQADKVQGAIDELYACASNYAAYNQRLTAVESQIYPIGSIYISTTDSTASAVHDRFGGTWVAYATGRTLIGVGTGTDSNSTSQTFAVNSTGGEYTHKLTIAEMPSHSHQTNGTNTNAYGTNSYGAVFSGDYQGRIMVTGISVNTTSSGNDNYHNNIQPYITVYMWKRTA